MSPTKLLPGRDARFDEGFKLGDLHDLVLQVNHGIGYDDVIFTGR